jgi:uncharacterized protein YkwD
MSFTASRRAPLARALATLLAAGSLLVAPGAARAASCQGADDVPSAGTTDTAAAAVVCLVNAERTRRGLPAVQADATLNHAAGRFSGDMVRRGFFSHVSPTGASLHDRLMSADYGDGAGWKAGEALGWGTGVRATPEVLVEEWLDSAHHRKILLNPAFREFGIGVAPGAPLPTHSDLPGATYALDLAVITH